MSIKPQLLERQDSVTEIEIDVPDDFICALTMELMSDPVMTRYGQNYERSAIFQWLAAGNNTCPMTRQPLTLSDIISNHRLRGRILSWQKENEQDITVLCGDETAFASSRYFGILSVSDEDMERMRERVTPRSQQQSTRSRRGLRRLFVRRRRNNRVEA